MNRLFQSAAFALSALAIVVTPILASADVKTDAARLRTSRTAERYEVEVPGASIKAGGGQVFVNAPLATVRQVVTDYAHYQDFMPRFERSRIVRRTRDFSDVYLQVPILHGAATVWAVTRFTKPQKQADGSEIIEGVMTDQSNVSDFRATYRLIPIDDTHTVLKAELLIVPKLPLPGSMVTPELAFAADKAVTASRDRSEAAAVRVAAGVPTTP